MKQPIPRSSDKTFELIKEIPGKLIDHKKQLIIDDIKKLSECGNWTTPIESYFFLAMYYQVHINNYQDKFPCDLNEFDIYFTDYFNTAENLNKHILDLNKKNKPIHTVSVISQHRVGKYTADFLLNIHWYDENHNVMIHLKYLIECDGKDYHEQNYEQVEKAKKRNRYLQSLGYRVFYFTGKELYNNPFLCAKEIIDASNNELKEIIWREYV